MRIVGTKFWPVFLLIFLSMLLCLLFVVDMNQGSQQIGWGNLLGILMGQEVQPTYLKDIVIKFRLPKSLTALLAGLALSLSGLMMQTVFRNPLAGPYILGISPGAALGVALVMLGGGWWLQQGDSWLALGQWTIALAACLGAGLVLLLIVLLSLRVRDIMTILILGVLFGGATGAIVTILQYFSNKSALKGYILWTMGDLQSVTLLQVRVLMIICLFGVLLSFLSVKALNAFMMGESYARSIGIPVQASRILIFLSTSILAGGVTAFCGPIGFIGIAVPHLCRMIFQTAEHRILLPACMLLGGIVMLLSDLLAHWFGGSGQSLPINAITALIGIPVIVWVIIRNRRLAGFR